VKTYTQIGMPFHGRAEDGVLVTPAGNKTVCNENFEYTRNCLVVRHPSAPGVTRSTEQLTHDTTQGHDWRDYALLCGRQRCVNGHEPGLGPDHWLYCDTSGPTWDVSITQTNNAGTIDFKLWLNNPFGRLGRQRSFTAQLLDTWTFTPSLPSWYGGSATVADVIAEVGFLVYQNDAGTAAVLNVIAGAGIAPDVYEESCYGDYTGALGGPALIATANIALSGNGDLDDNGNGITGTITADLDFETGIVTARESNGSQLSGSASSDTAFAESADPDCPTASNETLTYQKTWTPNGATPSASSTGEGFNYSAILMKTTEGTVTRSLRRKLGAGTISNWYTGSITGTFDLVEGLLGATGCGMFCTTNTGFFWSIDACSWTGLAQRHTKVDRYDYIDFEFNIFGEVFNYAYEYHYDDYTVYDMFPTDFALCGCTGGYSPGVSTDTEVETYTLNGVTLSGAGEVWHDFRPFAPNAVYFAVDYTNGGGGSGTDCQFEERYILTADDGTVSQELTQDFSHVAFSSGVPQMPVNRHWVYSWQPVTEEFVSAARSSISASYSGTVWQYC
jgi:hypothetical protein